MSPVQWKYLKTNKGYLPMSEFIEITEPTLILSIGVLCPDIEPDIYEATGYAWIVNGRRAEEYKLVLARRGIW